MTDIQGYVAHKSIYRKPKVIIGEMQMEEKQITPIKKGQLIVITEGAYSSYSIVTVCKALVDFDPVPILKAWRENTKEKLVPWNESSLFVKMLIVDLKLLKEIKFRELEIGDYYIGDSTNVRDYESVIK